MVIVDFVVAAAAAAAVLRYLCHFREDLNPAQAERHLADY